MTKGDIHLKLVIIAIGIAFWSGCATVNYHVTTIPESYATLIFRVNGDSAKAIFQPISVFMSGEKMVRIWSDRRHLSPDTICGKDDESSACYMSKNLNVWNLMNGTDICQEMQGIYFFNLQYFQRESGNELFISIFSEPGGMLRAKGIQTRLKEVISSTLGNRAVLIREADPISNNSNCGVKVAK